MIKNEKLDLKEFYEIRKEVLQTWPTGQNVSIEEGIGLHRTIPEERRFAWAMKKAREKRKTLLQPRAGVALIEDHIKLLRYLETEGQADLLPTTIDAYTRQNRYEEAERGIEKSKQAGTSLLNGFPAVNHGVEGCRRVVESVNRPLQVRHGTPDARLLAEITLAAGFTSFEGGGISYNIPYAKRVPVEKSLRDWQYVDRLVGLYEENGIRINREPFGPLTGTLVPPCISLAIGIIEGLLAAKQGVRSITLGYGQGGNIIQDVAAITALRGLAEEYLRQEGFDDFELTTVFPQWMGGFPEDEAKAFSVIALGAIVARLAGAEKVIVKSPHEAMGIPTKEANAQGLRATRQAINMVEDQVIFKPEDVQSEVKLIEAEVRSLLNKVYEIGQGEVAAGTVAAFEAGLLDVPFAPSIYNHGKIIPMRDNEGFIRIFNKGNLPLPEETMAFHRQRLQERARAEGRAISFEMVTDDIYAISKGKLVGRPK
ncbi:MAG: methylaspartate mutase subunit E [Candidatus Saccharicenans sp.]|jgi:methylaspartate mutase epsilon subunit|nr:methylaspartate mutase subunit E [Candidatus Saccharicenans sp.]MDH7492651.1 methylaspartate mutase subunit E [Candidatus Saccharicenans sp.]